MLSTSSVISSANNAEIVKIKNQWLVLDMGLLDNHAAHNKLMVDFVSSFLSNKKLSYIEITLFGNRIAYYSKENFIEAIQYIKANYDEFAIKSHAIKNNIYEYGEADLLYKNHTFSQEELLFWDQLSQVVFLIPTTIPSSKNILKKINFLKIHSKKEVKNVLRFAPVGFAALAIILGYVKQMDDPEHISQSKSSQKSDFGTYYSYTLEHKDLPNGLKILHLSDLHLDLDRPENTEHLARFAEEMDSVDFVFLTGDLFHREHPDTLMSLAAPSLKMILSKSHQGFFVLGNHDYYGRGGVDPIIHFLDTLGYRNSTNNYYTLIMNGQKVGIAGLDDFTLGMPNSEKITLDTSENVCNIMLTHSLDGYHPLQEHHQFVDLVLSGHLHSGEIEMGFINGTIAIDGYVNKNHQLVGRKKLPETETMSYISPGFSTINGLGPRLFTNPAGATHIEFKKITR